MSFCYCVLFCVILLFVHVEQRCYARTCVPVSTVKCEYSYEGSSGNVLWVLQESQTELVMLILLRLAEDVVTFQTLPPQRRRDIQQTLTQNMDSIFSFILAILQINADDYRKLVRGSSTRSLSVSVSPCLCHLADN